MTNLTLRGIMCAVAHLFNRRPEDVRTTLAALSLAAATLPLQAQPITVPNFSFESQSGAGYPFGVNVYLDSWQKPENPGYPEGGEFYWIQSAGAFVGIPPNTPNPYSNLLGTQAAYVLSMPGAGLFQDDQTTDWSGAQTGLNATYQVGLSYQLTLGVFGKGMVEDYSSLELSLYYRDGASRITIGTPTTITFDTAIFNPAGPFALVDYSVIVPTVQAGDAWAYKNIGISIASVLGDGSGYWDMDNVRLVAAVPEPGSLTLAALGLSTALFRQMRSRGAA